MVRTLVLCQKLKNQENLGARKSLSPANYFEISLALVSVLDIFLNTFFAS